MEQFDFMKYLFANEEEFVNELLKKGYYKN